MGSTGLVRWQLGSVTPGTSGVLTLVVNVISPLPNGTVIANTASIADTQWRDDGEFELEHDGQQQATASR